ncbi:DUF4231 domain-containing protein [Kitasatospora sp. NPDC058170]|uniref:DUF4231 domain-containing protein n=1 Tax=Kitasatospora sp. NPDC058170 TaxID=3346364 RepID=UPI0036DF8DAE
MLLRLAAAACRKGAGSRTLVCRAAGEKPGSEAAFERQHWLGSQIWWDGLARVEWPDVPPSVGVRGTWYRQNMRSARWRARLLDLMILVLTAGVPFAVAVRAENWVVALLGSFASLLTGMRHVFDWQGAWISFSRANLQIEAEVVRYRQGADEYADRKAAPGILVTRVEMITAEETGAWARRLTPPVSSETNPQ